MVDHAEAPADINQGLVLLEVSCGQHDEAACVKLGFVYSQHPKIDRSPKRSQVLFGRACGRKDGTACNAMGVASIGSGAPISLERAAKYFRKACDMGSADGCDNLGLTQVQDQFSGSKGEALFAFEEACRLGSHRGCHHLAISKLRDERQREAALNLLGANCSRGFSASCSLAAQQYAPLLSTVPECTRALAYARVGCQAKDQDSCAVQAACHLHEDPASALRQLESACSNKHALSCLYWADAEERKIQGLAEPERLVAAYRAACSSDTIASAPACVRLASKALAQATSALDAERSVEYLKGACQRGSGEACCRIGEKLGSLIIPEPDPTKPQAYRTKACHLGYASCCPTTE